MRPSRSPRVESRVHLLFSLLMKTRRRGAFAFAGLFANTTKLCFFNHNTIYDGHNITISAKRSLVGMREVVQFVVVVVVAVVIVVADAGPLGLSVGRQTHATAHTHNAYFYF